MRRPRSSRRVTTTPRGLWSISVRRGAGAAATGLPSTAISCRPGSARSPARATRPSTVTRPWAMSASAARRLGHPRAASTFWSRSAASGGEGRSGP